MTSISFNLNKEQIDFLVKKYNLNLDSNRSIDLQLKDILLNRESKKNYKDMIDRQKYLRLCLENWNLLKNAGMHQEEIKQIVKGDMVFQEPMISRLDKDNFCTSCQHQHADTEPKVCKNIDCPCGMIQ